MEWLLATAGTFLFLGFIKLRELSEKVDGLQKAIHEMNERQTSALRSHIDHQAFVLAREIKKQRE